MDKKFLVMSVVFFLIVGIFCGCERREEKSGRKINLRFENWEVTPAQLKIWQEVTDSFNQSHPNIYVNFQSIQGGTQKILVEMAGGAAPDVFFWDTDILSPLVKKRAIVNLTPFIKEAKIDPADYFTASWSGCVYGEGIFGLPCYGGSCAIAYNKDLFDRAGVAYPSDNWTWNDFLEIAQKLTIRKNGKIIQYGATPPSPEPFLVGKTWFDEKGNFIGDDKEIEEFLQFIQDLKYKYKVATSMAGIPRQDYYRTEMELFMTGKVAMFEAFTWPLITLKNIKTFQWDVVSTPRWKGKKRCFQEGSGILCISTQSKHPKEAFKFVKFACSKEGESILGKGGNLPSLKEAAYSSFINPPPENIKVFLTQSEEVKVLPSSARFPWKDEWGQLVLTPELDKLYLNMQSAKETLKNLKINTEKFVKEQNSFR